MKQLGCGESPVYLSLTKVSIRGILWSKLLSSVQMQNNYLECVLRTHSGADLGPSGWGIK